MKAYLYLGLLLALGTGGCYSNKETIVFSDEKSTQTEAGTAAAVKNAPKKLSPADENLVEQQVFGYLLGRHFWDNGDYTAVYLQTSDEQVETMQALFPHHVPPIKLIYHANLPSNRTPIDRDTGKPAMVLTAETGEPNADDSVDVIGRWYAGGAVTGFYSFHLHKADGNWQIDSVN